jgi:Na+/proline symporter
MLSGFIVVVAWHYLGWTTYTYEMLPGVAVGTLVLIVVSLFTPRGRASQKVTALLDEFKAPSPVPDIARSEASELWAAKAWLLSRGAVEGSG